MAHRRVRIPQPREELSVTTDSPEAEAAFERAVWSHVAHRADTVAHLDHALRADPALVLGHVMRGFGLRLLARGDLIGPARVCAEEAKRSLASRGGSDRERKLVHALVAFCAGDLESASARLEQASTLYPACLFSMKTQHAVAFMHGQIAALARHSARLLRTCDPQQPGFGFVLGCHAFALGETGDLVAAARFAREALARCGEDAWAYHALLHAVTHERGALREVLRERAHFGACANFKAHLAWHHGLHTIDERALDAALALYDHELLPWLGRDYRDAVNCVSLLYRAEHAGADVGARWQQLADHALLHAGDHTHAFADAHYVLALAHAGRADLARDFVQSMREHAHTRDDARARVALTVVENMLASCDPGRVPAAMTATDLQSLGGSRMQRALFQLIGARTQTSARVPTSAEDRSRAAR